MRKKGSLNLSINAIVVLILAITMLGLGLSFMRNIFGGATDQFSDMSAEVEEMMIDQLKESGETVALSRTNVEIEIGEKKQIYIGYTNDQTDDLTFSGLLITCDGLSGGSGLNCANDVNIGYLTQDVTVNSGETMVLPISVEAKTVAEEGTCFCTVSVTAGQEEEKTELIINVEV